MIPGSLATAEVWPYTYADNDIALGLLLFRIRLAGIGGIVRFLKSRCAGGTGALGGGASAMRRRGLGISCICQNRFPIRTSIQQRWCFRAPIATSGSGAQP